MHEFRDIENFRPIQISVLEALWFVETLIPLGKVMNSNSDSLTALVKFSNCSKSNLQGRNMQIIIPNSKGYYEAQILCSRHVLHDRHYSKHC